MKKYYLFIPIIVALGFLVFPFIIYHGHSIMVVTSESMLPTLKPHDLIAVKKTTIDNVQTGDIIAFDSHLEDLGIIAHRVVEILQEDDMPSIITQGDNIDEPDSWKVRDEDFIGIMTDSVPIIGLFLVEPIRYTLTAIIIILSIFLLKEIMTESKIQKKHNDKK